MNLAGRIVCASMITLASVCPALPAEEASHGSSFSPQVGYGPLFVDSQSPLQSIRLTMMPHAPALLPRGKTWVHLGTTWVNVWASDEGLYELDYEQLQVTLFLAYGLRDDMAVGFGLRDRSQFGGVMDGLVQGFHDLFGIDQNGRDLVPRNRLAGRIYADPQNPIVIESSDHGSIARSLTAIFAHQISRGDGGWPAIAYAVSAQHNLMDRLQFRGGSGLDLGLSLAASRRFGRVYLYTTLGYTHFGSESVSGIDLRTNQASASLAGEVILAPRHSLVVNLMVTEGAAVDFGAFSDASTELTIGWKHEIFPATVLEVGLVENIVTFDNSPDFGFHLALSRQY